MWLNLKFALQFSLSSIQKNLLRSLSIIVSIILIVSTAVTMLGWLEESPKKAIEAAFENRGYEIEISEIYHHEGGLEALADYLQTEDLVESTSIIHRSMFLYNLDNRTGNFSVLNPSENQSDFYISQDDLSDGVFFVADDFFDNMKHLLEFEEGSDTTFRDDENNSQVIISRHMLALIEQRTNQSDLTIGSPLNFSIAMQFLPRYQEELRYLLPFNYTSNNVTIGGIYDRIPSQTQLAFGLEFYHETIGDGLFMSDDLLPENITIQIEENGFFPTLYIRLNRTFITQLPLDQVTTQINHLSARIYQQGRYRIEIQIDEANSLLQAFSDSYIVLILMLLPILLLAEIFFLALTPHLINTRVEEFFYLRLRGTSDRKMALIEGAEFILLMSLGVLFGIWGGEVFLDILLSTNEFLQIPPSFIKEDGRSLIVAQNETLILGIAIIALVNLGYFFFLFQRLLKRLQHLATEKRDTRTLSSDQSFTQAILKLLIGGFIVYLVFTTVAPTLLNELGASEANIQLIPLITVLLMLLWIFFSFFFPQFSIQIIQSIFDTLRIFNNPKRRLTWINLFRRRNQFIGLLALITLTISLLSFTIVWEETIQRNSNQNAAYSTGGDYKLVTNDVNSVNFSAQLENMSFIDHCIGLPKRTVTISRYSITLIGIDPDEYLEVASLYPRSIVTGASPSTFWHSLNEDSLHSIIINDYLSEVFKWYIETTVQATELLAGYGAEWNLTVTGILNSAPGIGSLFPEEINEGFDRFGGFAFVHKDLLDAFGTTSANIFLLRVNNNSEIQESFIIDQLKELTQIRAVISATTVEQYQQNFFHLAGVQGILTLDALGAIMIAILGVSVFYQYLINERFQEFAVFQAFGATRSKIIRLAFNESIFLISIGIVLGVLTGNLFALGFLATTRTVTISPSNIFLLEMVVSPTILVGCLVVVTVIIILAAMIPLRKLFTLEITHLLREL
ncbi:MAG: ABC transporter permease [Candidatus Hodarchaeales archaeon]|jgi:ABC-type antimicrobial peptide transport system permease subunit